jgi:hypothetical protein
MADPIQIVSNVAGVLAIIGNGSLIATAYKDSARALAARVLLECIQR